MLHLCYFKIYYNYHMSSQLVSLINEINKNVGIRIQGNDIGSAVKSLIYSSNCESAFYLKKLIKYTNQQSVKQQTGLITSLNQNINNITNIAVFVVVYGEIKSQPNKHYVNWFDLYKISCEKGEMIKRFTYWALNNSQNPQILKQLLKITLEELPKFYKSQFVQPTERELFPFLSWLSLYDIKDRAEYVSVCQVIRLIKEIKESHASDYQQKVHQMLKIIIEILGYEGRNKGCLYMLFDPFSIRQNDIEYFCHIYQNFIEDLDQKHICNVFIALTRGGINRQILSLINKISHILQVNQQYYTLRIIYQQFILPTLAFQYKTHKKLYDQVYRIVLFYVNGFLAHCALDYNGLFCILNNLEYCLNKVEWAEIALLICKGNKQLLQCTNKKMAMLKISSSMANLKNSDRKVWAVTLRNGRKLKKYPQIDSIRFKGIVNRLNQCYIISSVQSLFLSQELPKLLECYKSDIKRLKLEVVFQLGTLFTGLSRRQDKLTVKYVKSSGPFKQSSAQEDTHEYILMLFQSIEFELKNIPKCLSEFQQIFNIQYSKEILCSSCQKSEKLTQHTYMHSIGTNETFKFQGHEQKLQDYKCNKCKSMTCSMITKISNRPKIIFIHINRFSHHGIVKKMLGNRPIKRKVGQYQLIGFISHKGSKISSGHYIFYGKVGKNRWAIFNDTRVSQFDVNEEEEFERQFRGQNTPYILLYELNKIQ